MDRHQSLYCHVFVTYLAKNYQFRQGIFVSSSKNMYSVTQRTKLFYSLRKLERLVTDFVLFSQMSH